MIRRESLNSATALAVSTEGVSRSTSVASRSRSSVRHRAFKDSSLAPWMEQTETLNVKSMILAKKSSCTIGSSRTVTMSKESSGGVKAVLSGIRVPMATWIVLLRGWEVGRLDSECGRVITPIHHLFHELSHFRLPSFTMGATAQHRPLLETRRFKT